MAINALPGRAAIFAEPLPLHVAAPAERVELLFDQRVYRWIRFMAVKTQTLAGFVHEVVMTVDAVHSPVIEVCEGQGQQWPCGPEIVLPLEPEKSEGQAGEGATREDQQVAHAATLTPAKQALSTSIAMPQSAG